MGNEVVSNTKKDTMHYHQLGDRALCKVLNIDYEEYDQMELEEQLELSREHLQETIDLILYENILTNNNQTNEYIDKYNLIDKYIPIINVRHINNCSCCDLIKLRLIDVKVKEDIIKNTKLTYPADPAKNAVEMVAMKMNAIPKDLDEQVLYYIKQSKHSEKITVCPLIKNEMTEIIKLFSKDYDLSKAKVQMVVGGILSYQASLIESTKHFKDNGLFEIKADKFGNPIQTISSNEYYKLKLNEKIIDAIKILDQMIEGNKNVNINLNQNALSIEDVLKKFKK